MNPTTFDLLLMALILAWGIWGVVAGAFRLSVPFVLVLVGVTILYAYPKISDLFRGPEPVVKAFLYLLVLFIALVTFGLLMRIVRNAVSTAGLGSLDKISGLAIGLLIGALLTGALIWGIETYGDGKWQILLRDSKISPSALTFFRYVMSFTERLFPQPLVRSWWKKSLW